MAFIPCPRSIEQMERLRNAMDTSASRERRLAYRPHSTDVVIATYPTCGTTWLQQILHALRTRGDMSFSEITQVVLGLRWLTPSVWIRGLNKSHLRECSRRICPGRTFPKAHAIST
ncbi:MAG: hypothetical protein ACI9W2_001284 [Gammaproteobacteria bacterium]|jgi:hypothetical protein